MTGWQMLVFCMLIMDVNIMISMNVLHSSVGNSVRIGNMDLFLYVSWCNEFCHTLGIFIIISRFLSCN
jgi:hypothetical protein